MQSWSRPAEVVHTSTFTGAPLACAAALETLDVLERERLVERASRVGSWFMDALGQALAKSGRATVRGSGMMMGIELGAKGAAVRVAGRLL